MDSLLKTYLDLMMSWSSAFARKRVHLTVVELILGLFLAPGRKTITAAIPPDRDWTSSYRAFSKASWSSDLLFQPVIEQSRQLLQDRPFIAVALDDTATWKTGKSNPAIRWLRDPLSPPFHTNLRLGMRWVHAALLVPMKSGGALALSVGWRLACPPKKPRRGATPEDLASYRQLQKSEGLGGKAVTLIHDLRDQFTRLGMTMKILVVVDGGYTNHTVLRDLPKNTDLIGRTRKDIAICLPAPKGGRKVYGEALPTPEEIRKDPLFAWSAATCFYGGRYREIRYKQVPNILWKRGGRRRPLRLLVVAPTRYRPVGVRARRYYYNQPAYLLTTDLDTPAGLLLQAYLDRWQIEVLHRDLKHGLGLGQAQVWTEQSVNRLHPTIVAAFALLKLAALLTFGPERAAAFDPLPLWRTKKPRTPTLNDLISLLQREIDTLPPDLSPVSLTRYPGRTVVHLTTVPPLAA
jgi:hypothetical protein